MQTHLDSPMTRFAVIAVMLAAVHAAPAQAEPQSAYTQPLPMYAPHDGGYICRTPECFGREAILRQVRMARSRHPYSLTQGGTARR